jgi:hypothetical protein
MPALQLQHQTHWLKTMQSPVRGLCQDLPPAKLMMYADDTNIFVDDREDLCSVKWTLDDTTDTLGSSFNDEKTVIKF